MSISLKTVRCTIAAILCALLVLTSPIFCFEANATEYEPTTETVCTID